MTTIENLTLSQINQLSTEAAYAGDTETVRDCDTVYDAYIRSDNSDLRSMIDEERGEIREAAARIVTRLRNA